MKLHSQRFGSGHLGVAPGGLARRCDRARRLGLVGLLVAGAALLALPGGRAAAQAQIPVNIESTPPGAQVFLGAPGGAPLCVTPCRNVRVRGGTQTLFFRLDRHADAQITENLRRRATYRATLSPLSTITVSAGNDAAMGAAVRIDGVPAGNVPFSQNVQPGRHMVQVGREGYVTFSQWVDVASGQQLALPVTLEREAPQTGSIMVVSDVSGAEVRMGGQVVGTTPAFLENIPPGQHTLEVRAPNLPPRTETVFVQTGQRATVNVTLRPAAVAGGTIRALANVPGARISIDGELVGPSPATRDNLSPGEHVVEATADGYEPAQQIVAVESGQTRVVSLTLQQVQLPPGRIVVNANVAGAIVTIDGEERGQAPVVVERASGGAHAIVVAAQGYESFRTTCEIRGGQNCVIDARLQPIGTPVLVTANVEGAQLFVDGRPFGPVPYEGNLPVGQHQIEVRAEGHRTFVAQIDLQPSAERRAISATLRNVAEEEAEERRVAEARRRLLERRTAMIHAAGPLPQDMFVLGVSTGWPHLLEMRLGVGLNEYLEAGFTIRSMFSRATEFEGRVELSKRFTPQIAAGVAGRIGGGIGPGRNVDITGPMGMPTQVEYPINTFSMALEGLFSLYFGTGASVTLWTALDFYTDQYGFRERDSDVALPIMTGDDLPGRNSAVRLRIGGALEFVLGRNWNAWGSIDGILADGNGTEANPSGIGRRGLGRRMYGDWLFFGTDPELYLRLGVTYKF
jgi:hypothetical protein